MLPGGQPRPREIRVFVSSTFRDMQEEREELVKRIFPQLRRLCESRGVTWGEVDLRWGVPDEAKAEGKVLPLCLAEIDRCRPYFVGLLGERFGWVPEQLPEELLEAQPWLNGHRNESVTAVEIFHGVLRNPKMAAHAFFYFRNPDYAASRVGFTEEDPGRRTQLATLKETIRRSGSPIVENFATPKELGAAVLDDLVRLIERLYPASTVPEPLDRLAADHENYAANRRRVYIGRPEYIERLDSQAAGDGPPLVVLGDSGAGKSALLANWTQLWSEKQPQIPLITHFIGAAPDSADWMVMLRRIMGELRRRFGIQIETSDHPDSLRTSFAKALHLAGGCGRVVLVLDGLNQIEDHDGAPDLIWLPPVLPANVRLIISTLPGRPLQELLQRDWPVLTVEPLKPAEREMLIVEYLKQFAKQLSADHRQRIAAAPQSANGLYLTTLLNELRLFGRHEELERRIDWYLEAANPLQLYGKVILRWEQDYEQADPGGEDLVGESLSRLWAARRGLSEAELLEALGPDDSPLSHALWSPLLLAAGDALVNRSGVLTFGHDYLREAVREAYLPTLEHEKALHKKLATYFAERGSGPRQLEELPWQYAHAEAWSGLARLLAEPSFFEAAWNRDQFEVKGFWREVEDKSPLRLVDLYATVLAAPSNHLDCVQSLSYLMSDMGHPAEAAALTKFLVERSRSQGNRKALASALTSNGLNLSARGATDGALEAHREAAAIYKELDLASDLAICLGNQAAILIDWGEFDKAMELLGQQQRIAEAAGNRATVGTSLGNQGVVLALKGDLDGALLLRRREEKICRELGDLDGLARSFGDQALILLEQGNFDGALAMMNETGQIASRLGNPGLLQASLGNQAVVLRRRGDLDGAIRLLREQESVCRRLNHPVGLAQSLGNQALIASDCGELDDALRLTSEVEQIYRTLHNPRGLAGELGNRASILKKRGDSEGAMRLLKEQEEIYNQLGVPAGMASCLGGQADIRASLGDSAGAAALYRRQEEFLNRVGNPREIASFYGAQGVLMRSSGEIDRSLALFKKQEMISRNKGFPLELLSSLNGQASIYQATGDFRTALSLFSEMERSARQLGYREHLAQALNNLGIVHKDAGQGDSALSMFQEAETIFRSLDNRSGLARCLSNQAILYTARAEPNKALQLYREAETIFRRSGEVSGLAACLNGRALIEQDNRNWAASTALLRDVERIARNGNLPQLLATCLGNLAINCKSQGQMREAMTLLTESEALHRKLNDASGLAGNLGNQGNVLWNMGRLEEALAKYEEVEHISRELRQPVPLALSLINRAQLVAEDLNRPAEALPVAEEALRLLANSGIKALEFQIRPIVESIRRQCHRGL
jgi:tetratricopeptide (TPR) repeat protein